MKKGKHRDEKGYALVTTMFMLVVLTVIGLAAVFITSLDIEMAGTERGLYQCWDLADAGTREVLAMIITNTLPVAPPGGTIPPISNSIGSGSYTTGHIDTTAGLGISPVVLTSESKFYGAFNMTWKTAYSGFGYSYYIVPILARLGNTPCQEIQVAIRLFQ